MYKLPKGQATCRDLEQSAGVRTKTPDLQSPKRPESDQGRGGSLCPVLLIPTPVPVYQPLQTEAQPLQLLSLVWVVPGSHTVLLAARDTCQQLRGAAAVLAAAGSPDSGGPAAPASHRGKPSQPQLVRLNRRSICRGSLHLFSVQQAVLAAATHVSRLPETRGGGGGETDRRAGFCKCTAPGLGGPAVRRDTAFGPAHLS